MSLPNDTHNPAALTNREQAWHWLTQHSPTNWGITGSGWADYIFWRPSLNGNSGYYISHRAAVLLDWQQHQQSKKTMLAVLRGEDEQEIHGRGLRRILDRHRTDFCQGHLEHTHEAWDHIHGVELAAPLDTIWDNITTQGEMLQRGILKSKQRWHGTCNHATDELWLLAEEFGDLKQEQRNLAAQELQQRLLADWGHLPTRDGTTVRQEWQETQPWIQHKGHRVGEDLAGLPTWREPVATHTNYRWITDAQPQMRQEYRPEDTQRILGSQVYGLLWQLERHLTDSYGPLTDDNGLRMIQAYAADWIAEQRAKYDIAVGTYLWTDSGPNSKHLCVIQDAAGEHSVRWGRGSDDAAS